MMEFFQWLATTRISIAMRNRATFATVDMIHMIGMVVLIGTIVIVSLRLLGMFMRSRSVPEIAEDVRWGTRVGLATMLITGPLVLIPEPIRWYTNNPFRVKMALVLLALVFHFTIYRRVTRRADAGPWLRRFTGVLALVLWFSVAWAGRLITVL